ncbi:MAG: bifunctional methylenetetrahydrofolate dehydrogenase/methenyltetrahydrofolate cyclohydrolase, partial [candidate division Zixibacteria bacterium]|nr:bifunctional methylenetetrahydrofolate dehydrogenase/methenyltetrahydrofolate cyclohydrolase [candidate division Zixibacteria bacterium]
MSNYVQNGSNRRSIGSAELIDGKKISEQIRAEVKVSVDDLKNKGIVPGLAAVLVGDNPASQIYVRSKAKACDEAGIYSEVLKYPKEMKESELLELIDELNHKEQISGILVQLPLPEQISEEKIIKAISPEKDVDGFHPYNLGLMLAGKPTFLPC